MFRFIITYIYCKTLHWVVQTGQYDWMLITNSKWCTGSELATFRVGSPFVLLLFPLIFIPSFFIPFSPPFPFPMHPIFIFPYIVSPLPPLTILSPLDPYSLSTNILFLPFPPDPFPLLILCLTLPKYRTDIYPSSF